MLDLESSVERRRGSTPLICIASHAGLAQLVEHLICNQRVTGSSPVVGINRKIKNTFNKVVFLMELRIKNNKLLVGKTKKMEVATREELKEIIKVAVEQLQSLNN